MLKWIDAISLRAVLWAGAGWLLLFAFIYAVFPCFLDDLGELKGSPVCEPVSIPIAMYISVSTMFSLGYSDIFPVGALRIFAAVQVIGGVVLAGLAVASIVAMPANHTRLAIRACRGHWVECVDLPGGRRFFSFTTMLSDGISLIKRGRNIDPHGTMNGTRYDGTLVTNLFPTLMSIYQNDHLSTDYTDGIFKFKMELGSDSKYRSYAGACLDEKHGGRDRIHAKKIEDAELIKKLEDGTATEDELLRFGERLFGALSAGPAAPLPTILETTTRISKAP